MRPFKRKAADKKALAESVIASLSSNFLSLQGLSFAVRLAVKSLVSSGDFTAAIHLAEAIDAVKIYVCNKRKGAEKKNKPQSMKKGKIIEGIGRDYMHANIIREHLAAVDAFQPNVDVHLLTSWAKLEELVVLRGQKPSPEAPDLTQPSSVEAYVADILKSAVDQVVAWNGAPAPDIATPPSPALLHKQLQATSERFLLHLPGSTSYKFPIDQRFETAEKVLLHVVARCSVGTPSSHPPISTSRLETFETRLAHACNNINLPIKYGTRNIPGMGRAEDLVTGLRAASDIIKSRGDVNGTCIKSVAREITIESKWRCQRFDECNSFLSAYKLHLVKSLLGGGVTDAKDAVSVAKLARKQGNIMAAERILQSVDFEDVSLPEVRYEAACLDYKRSNFGPAIDNMLSMAEECEDGEHRKFRCYLRIARWLHESDKRRNNPINPAEEVEKPCIYDIKIPVSDTPDPAITISLKELYEAGSSSPEQVLHPLSSNIINGYKCLMNACHLQPGASKPLLRLGEVRASESRCDELRKCVLPFLASCVVPPYAMPPLPTLTPVLMPSIQYTTQLATLVAALLRELGEDFASLGGGEGRSRNVRKPL